MNIIHRELFAGVVEVMVRVGDVERIGWEVFFDDIPRPAAQPDSFALSDGIKPDALMRREFAASLDPHDVARLFTEMETDERRVFDFSEETNPLAVLPVAIRQ